MNKNVMSLCFCSLVGISSLNYAAYTNPNLVATQPKFEISLGALYLQPSSSNLDYAVLGYPFPTESPHWNVQTVKPTYSLGFDLRGRYFIPDTNYDVAASWDHLNTSDSDFTQVGTGSGLFVVIPFQAGPSFGQSFNNPSQQATSTVKFYYDVINLDIGKNIDFTPYTEMRFFVGLSGARLKQNISTTFADNAHTFSINSTNNSKFTGIGPLIGAEGKYKFISTGLDLFGAVTGSALVGSLDPSTNYTSSSPQLAGSGIGTNYQSISPKTTTQGVPGVDAKLGLDYSHSISMGAIFTASLGYEYATYFNAIATYNPSVVVGNINTGTIALNSLSKTTSNFTVQGPFINFGIAIL